jgi:PilZ domain
MDTRTETTMAAAGGVVLDGLRGRQTPLFVRIRTDMPAVLVDLVYGNSIRGRVQNLSAGGMFFRGADSLEVGARLMCALIRTDGEFQDELYVSGTVVHRQTHGVGIAFDEVTPGAFIAISDIIAAAGCFRLNAVEPRWPAHPERRAERKRPRPRKARMNRWNAALRAA